MIRYQLFYIFCKLITVIIFLFHSRLYYKGYPSPKLSCPHDILAEIPPNANGIQIQMPRPKTDIDFDKHITSNPLWIKEQSYYLTEGITYATITARHPESHISVKCTFKIRIMNGTPPTIKYCPESQKHILKKTHDRIKVFWKDPIFEDNINVTNIYRTNVRSLILILLEL